MQNGRVVLKIGDSKAKVEIVLGKEHGEGKMIFSKGRYWDYRELIKNTLVTVQFTWLDTVENLRLSK